MLIFSGVLHVLPATRAVSFTWDPSPDQATGKVLGYKLYYSTQSFSSLPTGVATNPAFKILTVTSGTTANVTDLLNGVTYYMTVTAFGTNQESSPSNVLMYTPGGPTPPLISIASPVSNISVLSTNLVSVTATASGSAAIAKVEFFDGA
ncbi:MAG TPA: fibronectin type III domain-containing protein, partial [Pyrinomonadaceae bacterium]|nr:fibronectin type III domain-containing protein [Pyrinomonadaceae bacterium]